MNKHRFFLSPLAVILLVLSFGIVIPAASLPNVPPEISGVAAYREAQTLVYSETGTVDQVSRLLERARRSFADTGDRDIREYWDARTYLLMGTHHNQNDQTRAAVAELNRGFTAIRGVLDRSGPFSEGLRVLSDLHSQMMFARGLIYMARNGGEARDAALQARELDPNNTLAAITVAGYYLNAPSFAGGDTELGREILRETLQQNPSQPNDRFLVLGLLAQASLDLDDPSAARRYYREAQAIYPQSRWLGAIAAALSSR